MSMWKFLKTDQGKAEYIRRKKAMPDLPSNWDFHLATKNLPLERAQKTKIQIAMSKMDKKTLKETLDILGSMRFDAIRAKNYKMAAYCKAVHEFGEKYLISLEWQKKI